MIGGSANKHLFGSIAKMQGTLHPYQYETVIQLIYPQHASHTKSVGEGSPQYLKIIYKSFNHLTYHIELLRVKWSYHTGIKLGP